MEDHLEELCKDMNLDPELEKSEEGFRKFPLNEALTIEVKMLEPGVLFYSPIAECPEKKQEELFILLMKANLFGQGTFGGAIGYEREENLLTLSSAFPYEMKYLAFRDALEDFANVVDYWKGAVNRHVELAEGGIL